MHRWIALLALLAACGSGGGRAPVPLPQLQSAVDVGTHRANATALVVIGVDNPFAGEAEAALAEEPDGPFAPAADQLPATVVGGGRLTFGVEFTAADAGPYEGDVVLLFTPADGGATQEVVVALTARAEEGVLSVVNAEVDLGNVRIGESATAEIRVRNPSLVTPLEITGANGLPAAFSLAAAFPVTLAAGAEAAFTIRYEPEELGAPEFDLSFANSAGSALAVRVRASTTTWVDEIVTDFGSVPVSGGETSWLEVEVPPHAISLSLEVRHPTATIGLLGFEGPGGRVYENASATGAFLWSPGDEVFTATLPSSDREELKLVPGGGTYRFRFYTFVGFATSFEVRAIVENRPDAVVTAGVLHLNVFLAQGLGITAAGAPTNTRLQAIIEEMDRIFEQIGLGIGDVDYYVLDDPRYDRVRLNEFDDLCEESAVADEVRLNLFFVEDALSGNVVGAAAAVPGPAANGTVTSGVMVDYDFGNVATTASVAAHELGHYLGLLHTVESDGLHDLIDDTLECPADGTDDVCEDEGAGYLMHWRVLNADPVITAGQGRVVLGHPLVGPTSGLTALLQRRLAAVRGPLTKLPEGWCGTRGCCPK